MVEFAVDAVVFEDVEDFVAVVETRWHIRLFDHEQVETSAPLANGAIVLLKGTKLGAFAWVTKPNPTRETGLLALHNKYKMVYKANKTSLTM